MSSRAVAAAPLLILLIIAVATGLRVAPTVMPASTGQSPASEAAIPSPDPSPTSQWGGPLPNGAPGPGGSPCIEIDPGDCGVVTNYDAGLVPYEPSPRR